MSLWSSSRKPLQIAGALFLLLRGVSFTFISRKFSQILVDSTLATCSNGEQKFSCLQFASSAHKAASEVMETFCIFYKFSIDMNDIVVVFYFYSRRNKSKKTCLMLVCKHYR